MTVSFSKGVVAENLNNMSALRTEIGDVLEVIGWLEDDAKVADLVRCVGACSTSEKRVLACTFAHLRAMIQMINDPDIDIIIEDNVRVDINNTHTKFHKVAREMARVKADLWYVGYLGRESDLAMVHPVPSTSNYASDEIVAPFPSGNIPLWGCYAYGLNRAALSCLLDELRQSKPSKSLFEAKRNKTKGMVTLPIDRMLPRRVRAHGLSIYRAVTPLLFRMPPPFTPQPSTTERTQPLSSSPAEAESQYELASASIGLCSTIHPHLDIRFFSATTFQLSRTGSRSWKNVWLLEMERESVNAFLLQEQISKSTVPFSEFLAIGDDHMSKQIESIPLDAASSAIENLKVLLKVRHRAIDMDESWVIERPLDAILSNIQRYASILSEHLGILTICYEKSSIAQVCYEFLIESAQWLSELKNQCMKKQEQTDIGVEIAHYLAHVIGLIDKALCFLLRIFSRAGYKDPVLIILEWLSTTISKNKEILAQKLISSALSTILISTVPCSHEWKLAWKHWSCLNSNKNTCGEVVKHEGNEGTGVTEDIMNAVQKREDVKLCINGDTPLRAERPLYDVQDPSLRMFLSKLIQHQHFYLNDSPIDAVSTSKDSRHSKLFLYGITRFDLDRILVSLLKQRISSEDSSQVRVLLRDWFNGFTHLSIYGPESLRLHVDGGETSQPIGFYRRYLPDMRHFLVAVECLCGVHRSTDARWLLQEVAPQCLGLWFTERISSYTYCELFRQAFEMKEPIRTLLVGACASGDVASAHWALNEGGMWCENQGLQLVTDLPLRCTRSAIKHIGACSPSSSSEEASLVKLAITILERSIMKLSTLYETSFAQDMSTPVSHWHSLVDILTVSAMNKGSLLLTSTCLSLTSMLHHFTPTLRGEKSDILRFHGFVTESMILLCCIVNKYDQWYSADERGRLLWENDEEEATPIPAGQTAFPEAKTWQWLLRPVEYDSQLTDKKRLFGCLQTYLPKPCLRLLLRDCYCSKVNFKRINNNGGSIKLLERRRIWMEHVVAVYHSEPYCIIDQRQLKSASGFCGNEELEVEMTSDQLYIDINAQYKLCGWLTPLCLALRWAIVFSEQRSVKDTEQFKVEVANLIAKMIDVSTSEMKPNQMKVIELLLSTCFSVYTLELLPEKSATKLLSLIMSVYIESGMQVDDSRYLSEVIANLLSKYLQCQQGVSPLVEENEIPSSAPYFFNDQFKDSTEPINVLEFCFSAVLPITMMSTLIHMIQLDDKIVRCLLVSAITKSLVTIRANGFRDIRGSKKTSLTTSISNLSPWKVAIVPTESTGTIFSILANHPWLSDELSFDENMYLNRYGDEDCKRLVHADWCATMTSRLQSSTVLTSFLPTFISTGCSNPQPFIKFINKSLQRKQYFIEWCQREAPTIIEHELSGNEFSKLRQQAMNAVRSLIHHGLGFK